MSNILHKPIEFLKGVGDKKATLLRQELGISSYIDLLTFFPYRYVDKTKYYKVSEVKNVQTDVQIIGKIIALKEIPQKRGKRLVAKLIDDTGILELVWFKGTNFFKNSIKLNENYVVFGKLSSFLGGINIIHPELELLDDHKNKLNIGLKAVYHSTEKLKKNYINSNFFGKILQHLLEQIQEHLHESLPEYLLHNLDLENRMKAFFELHFPSNNASLQRAIFRFKFEELFYIQLKLISKKITHKTNFKGYKFEVVGDYFNNFYKEYLPFELTNAQKRVVKEIRRDVSVAKHMNRLIQGDVGSGKTIVALLSMLLAIDNGFQACIMAPTEILATQHFNEICLLLKGINLNIDLLTGSTPTKKRIQIHQDLVTGHTHIIVGTHALLEKKIQFKNLGIAIIDEQHRFGVEQRAKMWTKNTLPPHILVMTATPIPRTLAMSLYGDLDISVIDELPPNRKAIKTIHQYEDKRLSVFHFIKTQIEKDRQIYIVYPLIEESEKLDYQNLMDGYDNIVRYFPLPDYRISIVHGKMKAQDKDFEMNRFIKGETQIMISTTVIEVGVNIPNASVMVIENAEKFGLSQLHQLRGRVGRGAKQSYCILMSSYKLSQEAKTRLNTMVETNDGFKVADADLKLRGPGNLEGKEQSGILKLKIANLATDLSILSLARSKAIEILNEDPLMNLEKNRILKTVYESLKKNDIWSNIS